MRVVVVVFPKNKKKFVFLHLKPKEEFFFFFKSFKPSTSIVVLLICTVVFVFVYIIFFLKREGKYIERKLLFFGKVIFWSSYINSMKTTPFLKILEAKYTSPIINRKTTK